MKRSRKIGKGFGIGVLGSLTAGLCLSPAIAAELIPASTPSEPISQSTSQPQSTTPPTSAPSVDLAPQVEETKAPAPTQTTPQKQVAPQPEASPASNAAPSTPGTPVTPTVPQDVTGKTTAEFAILTPVPDQVMDKPSTAVTIQYPLEAKVELRVNGELVDQSLIGRTETNNTTRRVTETWYGVTLNPGKDTITIHRQGDTAPVASVAVQVSGLPTQLKIKTRESRVAADGRSIANVEGSILDANSNRSNWNAIVTLETTSGVFVGTDASTDIPGFQVEATRGSFVAQLRSSTTAEPVRIRATTNELEAFYQFQFATLVRPDPLITGVASFRLGGRGTNFHDSLRKFLPLDRNNDTVLDAKAAAFGTASVGDWLITGAYNSDHPLNQDAEGNTRLFGDNQVSDQPYPVFGDSSSTERIAPSQDSLFLRAERTSPIQNAGVDYLMWGDFNTSEFATASQQFTATNRSLHGFKANYNLGGLQATVLYSNTVQGFQRDSISPDGTSGFYFLSRRLVIDGSEAVTLELEELNRPGTVISAKALQRGIDYTIDYDRGSLLFQEPLMRTTTATDGTVLVQKLIVTYQHEAPGRSTSIYGGRVRYHFSRKTDHESWLGGTYWLENQGAREFELYGADAQVSLSKNTRIIAEYAHSRHTADSLSTAVSGAAYRVDIVSEPFKAVKFHGFYRNAEAGFANNATLSFVPGQTRYGAEVTANVSSRTKLRFLFDHEDNFGIAPRPLTILEQLLNPGSSPVPGEQQDNSLTSFSAGVEQRIGKAQVGVNYIHRDRIDRAPAQDLKNASDQLEATFTMPLRDDLKLRGLATVNLQGDDPIYTNHAQVGLDWALNPNVTMSLNEHYFWGGQYGDRAITSLDTIAQHHITKDTALLGRFSLLGGANGMTGQGAVGVKHHWQVARGLGLDVGYEYVMGQFLGRTGAGQQFQQPYAVGSGASALSLSGGHNFSVGLDYTDNPNLKASIRYQYRTSSAGVNSVLTADALGKFTPSLTGLVRYEQGGAANQLLGTLGDTINLKVGLAYRDPKNDSFNALFRYEFRQNPATTPQTILIGSGTGSTDHTLAFEGIYAPNWRWELYGKMGYRYSTTYAARDFTSTNSLLLGQFRATYRINYRFDVTGEARILKSISSSSTEVGATAEVGYYLTPNLRLAAGYAFGSVSGSDFENSRSASGPYVGLTVKLDELFKGFRFYKKAVPSAQEIAKQKTQPEQNSPAAANSLEAAKGEITSSPAAAPAQSTITTSEAQ
jgi:hypothetical protein